jgi:hypothetical protein
MGFGLPRITTSLILQVAQTVTEKAHSQVAVEGVVHHCTPSYYSAPVIIQDRGWDWSSRTVINHNYAPKEEKKKKDDEDQSGVILAGAVIAVVFAGVVGYVHGLLAPQREALHELEGMQESIQMRNVDPEVTQQTLDQFDGLIHTQMAIDERRVTRTQNYFAAGSVALLSGLALAGGGWMVVPLLITAGKVGCFVAAMGGAVNMGLHCHDGTEIDRLSYKALAQARPLLA